MVTQSETTLYLKEGSMPGLFTKATEKAAEKKPAAKRAKGTAWEVGQTTEGMAVCTAVEELVKLDAKKKELDAQMKVRKGVVHRFAAAQHIADFAENGLPPDTPMKVMTAKGETVTFVVQDRSGQYKVSAEQEGALADLLGEDAAQSLLYTETSIGFERSILAKEGVGEAVEAALESAIAGLVEAGTLSEDQAGELIQASQKTSFKPGTMDRMAEICGQGATTSEEKENRMTQFADIAGSSCTRYVKV
jgi:hypothetical protein